MRRLPLALAGACSLVAGLALAPAHGSSPASSSLTVPAKAGKTAKVSYTGTIPAGSNPTSDCTTSGGATADSHTVVIRAPRGGYKNVTAVATFAITWKPATTESAADEILSLVAQNGKVIGSSDGSSTTEALTITNPASGRYRMLACGYVNASAQPYTGYVTVKTAPKAVSGKTRAAGVNTVNDHLDTFTPATVVDPILFGGEPGFTFDPTTPHGAREFVDWPVSSRTNIGVFFRSTDGGLSFQKRYADVTDVAGEDGPACAGRQVPYCASGGGGDTDTQVDPRNGHIYFSSQESLANEATGTSFNHGTTFPASHVDPVTHKAGGDVDRQWLGFWKGTNTVFLAYHSPIVGAYVLRNDHAGATGDWYLPSTGTAAGPPSIPEVTQTGAMEIDNTGGRHNHAIYVAYLTASPNASTLLDESLHVAVSTNGAKSFTSYKVPGGAAAENFTKLYIDTVGNLYAVWSDRTTNATFLATSKGDVGANRKHPGSVWKGPYRISAAPANVTIFPDVRAGSPGRMAAIYYGTSANAATPDDVKPGQGGWYPYVAVSTNALCMWGKHPCKSPRFHQMRVSSKISHNDNICTSGTACAATGGNRNLADYWDIDIDRQGHLGFVWGDTTNAIGYPFVKVSRQATGPSLYAHHPRAHLSRRYNGYPDRAGDAKFPIAGALILHAKNHPTLDLRGTKVALRGSKLEFTIRLTSTKNLGAGVPTGNDGTTSLQQAKYVVRWDAGLRSYYATATVPAGSGSKPTFASGQVSTAEGITSPTNPDNAAGFGNIYSALGPATGRVTKNAIVIDVPRSAVGSPKAGSRLVSVGSYTLVGGRDNTVTLETLPITVDSTPTFDVRLPGKVTHRAPAAITAGGIAWHDWSLPLTVAGMVLLAGAVILRRRPTSAMSAA